MSTTITNDPSTEQDGNPQVPRRHGWLRRHPAISGALAGVAVLAVTAGTGLAVHHPASPRSSAAPVVSWVTYVAHLKPLPGTKPGGFATYTGTLGGLGPGRHSLAKVTTSGVWSPSATCNAALRADPRAGHDSYDGYTIDENTVVIRSAQPTSGPEWVSAEHIGDNAAVNGSANAHIWTQAWTVSPTSGTQLDAACAGVEVDLDLAVLVETTN